MNPLRAWDRFWFAPTSTRPLGVFRILFGLVTLLHLGLYALDGREWLTDAGYLQGREARDLAGVLRPSALHWLQQPAQVHAFLATLTIVDLLVILGWRTRAMCVLLYLGLLSIHHRDLLACSGADALVVSTAFCLMLSPCGASFSLDALLERRWTGAIVEPLRWPWAQRMIQVQVCVLYFMTAALKAGGTTWQDGSALHYVLGNAEFRRWTFGLLGHPTLLSILTYGALLIEFALAAWLWFRPTRPYVIAAGIALHTGIMLTVNIPVFGELLMASYLTFLTADELDALARRLDPRHWLRRRASGVATDPTITSARPAGAIPAPRRRAGRVRA